MDLTIALEHRFARTPDGAAWTSTGLARPSWARYLGVFRRVRLLARAEDVASPGEGWQRVDGDGVELLAVPAYVGPAQYLRRALAVERAVRAALAAHPRDAVVLRLPGMIGTVAARALRAARRPFGVEVVGDPLDVFAPGALRHPLRPLLREWAARRLRAQCLAASSRLYVTSAALQRRYPGPPEGSFAASDAELLDEAYAAAPRAHDAPAGPPLRLVLVGMLEQLYKGPDVAIEAVARCAAAGLDVELAIVGGGRCLPELRRLAGDLGVAARVRFTDKLASGAAVRRELDAAHLFVLPSRAEGMPRALLEAMARGLPCLASPVGGIPELLGPEALVPSEARALAARIGELARDAALRAELSRRNLERAGAFRERVLQPAREAFFRHVAEAAARAQGAGAGAGRLAHG